MTNKSRVLIVEDDDRVAFLLQQYLQAADYTVSIALAGKEALRLVQEQPPDLILLDVMMPGMNGMEVCRRLKADPVTAIIPIIMTTAMAERSHRLQGISAGADDYLIKPVDQADLLLRVRNAIRMKSVYDDLQKSYQKLRRAEALRDHLIQLIVHDMRAPIQGILSYVQLMSMTTDQKHRKYLEQAQNSCKILSQLTDDMLAVHKMESGQVELNFKDTSIGRLWAEALSVLMGLASIHRIELASFIAADAFPIRVDPDLMRRVLINLVDNAIKFTPEGGRVEVTAREVTKPATSDFPVSSQLAGSQQEISWIVVAIQDNGRGIPEEYYEKIFEKFGIVEAKKSGTRRSSGLGLTFCKLAVEAHQGRIGVKSQIGVGSMFWFALPKKPESRASGR